MKRIALLLATVLTLGSFAACSIKEDTNKLIDDGKESYENIKIEVNELSEKVIKTKDKIDETIEDINVASDAIKEITQ